MAVSLMVGNLIKWPHGICYGRTSYVGIGRGSRIGPHPRPTASRMSSMSLLGPCSRVFSFLFLVI